jgi:RNA polymerase sigma-70 factor (ECF subfamily)
MPDATTTATKASLLLRVRDPGDGPAWAAFARRYEPVIRAACRRSKLGPADVDEVTQAVLVRLVAVMPRFRYDHRRGRFRDWLGRVARNRAVDFLRASRRRPDRGSGATWAREALDGVPLPPGADREELVERLEEQDRRHERLRVACARVERRVEPHTWEAFRLTAVERVAGEAVAARLGMKIGAVYVAKNRVTGMIRDEVRGACGDEPSGEE